MAETIRSIHTQCLLNVCVLYSHMNWSVCLISPAVSLARLTFVCNFRFAYWTCKLRVLCAAHVLLWGSVGVCVCVGVCVSVRVRASEWVSVCEHSCWLSQRQQRQCPLAKSDCLWGARPATRSLSRSLSLYLRNYPTLAAAGFVYQTMLFILLGTS